MEIKKGTMEKNIAERTRQQRLHSLSKHRRVFRTQNIVRTQAKLPV
jgi:hypothetical protein